MGRWEYNEVDDGVKMQQRELRNRAPCFWDWLIYPFPGTKKSPQELEFLEVIVSQRGVETQKTQEMCLGH